MEHVGEFRSVLLSATLLVSSACGGGHPPSTAASGAAVTKSGSGGLSVKNALGTGGSGPVDSGLEDAALSKCTWPAELDRANAEPGKCVASRVSSNCTRFPDGHEDCKNECQSDEYALACGGPGPGPYPTPNIPANCRLPTIVRAPICCPCGQ